MRKLFTIALTAAMAAGNLLPASAAPNVRFDIRDAKKDSMAKAPRHTRQAVKSDGGVRKANDEAPTYVKTVPETAEAKIYSRDWLGFWVFNYIASFIMQGEEYGRVQNLYFDGDDVYMQYPVLSFTAPGYLKGTKTEAGIHFDMPQCIYTYTDYESGKPVRTDYYVQPLYLDTEFFSYYTSDTGEIEPFDLTLGADGGYYWDNDRTVTAVDPDDGKEKKFMARILGVTNQDDEWIGYGDYRQKLTPFTDELTEVPADGETFSMTLQSGEETRTVHAVESGNKLWIKGLCAYNPAAWAKGTIEGETVKFERQYMGIDSDGEYFGYLRGADGKYVYDEFYESETLEVEVLDELVFDYDVVAMTMTARHDMIVGGGLDDEMVLEFTESPVLTWQAKTFVPNIPVITKHYSYDPDWGSGQLIFNIPALSLSGATLDTERLSYRIDRDWEPYVFTTARHTTFDEDMEWIPYDFSNTRDLYVDGDQRTVRYRENFEYMLGVTLRYVTEDGLELFSPTAESHSSKWSEEMTPEGYGEGTDPRVGSGVKAVETVAVDVVSTVYTDLSGRRLQNAPEKGIYLETRTMADGRRVTLKKVK